MGLEHYLVSNRSLPGTHSSYLIILLLFPLSYRTLLQLFLFYISKAFSRSTKSKVMCPCLSNLCSTSCLSENLTSVVPRPFLVLCCSSTNSCSTLPRKLLSRILYSNFIIWLSRVIPLYFPGSCASPFLFHMEAINPVRQSSGTCFMHVFNSLFVHLAPISPTTSTISARISSQPDALPYSPL